MTADAILYMRSVRERLAKLREIRQIRRDSPDKLRRDAAIISYSRTLDDLVDDLNALDDMGTLSDCVDRLDAEARQTEPDFAAQQATGGTRRT